MNKLYTLSPITTKQQFEDALAYIVRETTRLAKELTSTPLQLEAAKIFAHYPEEYEFLQKIIREYGEIDGFGRATSTYVKTSLDIEGSHLKLVGIRIPDPYRMQAGCGDYAVADPKQFIASLPKHPHGYIRPFPDMPDDFMELWHPDFDVAGYICMEQEA